MELVSHKEAGFFLPLSFVHVHLVDHLFAVNVDLSRAALDYDFKVELFV